MQKENNFIFLLKQSYNAIILTVKFKLLELAI